MTYLDIMKYRAHRPLPTWLLLIGGVLMLIGSALLLLDTNSRSSQWLAAPYLVVGTFCASYGVHRLLAARSSLRSGTDDHNVG